MSDNTINSQENSLLSADDFEQFKHNTSLQKYLSEMLQKRFETNLAAFAHYYPEISEKFKNYVSKRPFEFFCTDNGIPNVIFLDNGKVISQNSDPIAHCKNKVINILKNENLHNINVKNEKDPYGQIHYKYISACLNITKESTKDTPQKLCQQKYVLTCICLGVGLGYSLAELYERLTLQNLLLIEPDTDLFYTSLFTFDWNNLLTYIFENSLHIEIFFENEWNELYEHLFLYFSQHGQFLLYSYFIFQNSEHERYTELKNSIDKNWLSLRTGGFFDDSLFGVSHACNAILKQKNFVKKDVNLDNYKNYPVFIVGSGPSFDNDLHFIRKNQDKAIIVACGTAIDVLYHAGIKPDIYANTERTPEITQALSAIPDNNFFEDIFLMCSEVCHPNVTKLFKNTLIFSKYDEYFINYLEKQFPKIPKIAKVVRMNPLVANMGISGILALGFEKLYLFGIDCGRKIGTKHIHTKYATLYEQKGANDRTENYSVNTVYKANFCGLVECNQIYLNSATTIARSVKIYQKKNPKIVCVNCSDGIFIDNTLSMHSNDLIKEFDSISKINKKEFADYLTTNITVKIPLNTEEIRSIFSTNIFNRLCNLIIKELEISYVEKVDYLKNMQNISEFLSSFFKNYSAFYASLIDNSLQQMFAFLVKIIYRNTETDKSKLENCVRIIQDFLLEAQQLFSYLPDYVMGEHRKYFPNNKVGKDTVSFPAPLFPDLISIIKKDYQDDITIFEKKYD